jgi:inorganic phosphate transporter, PiT family
MALLLTVIFVALVFEYINGFHDTANSIATVVSTKVLSPRQAIILAACSNLLGALMGTAVAKTVSQGLVDNHFVTSYTLIAALFSAIVWNLVTWWLGLPSSSTHALVGGLCGATLASSHGLWNSIIWVQTPDAHWWHNTGVVFKVIVPMFTSPLIGLVVGFVLMSLLYVLLRDWRPATVSTVFGKMQLLSAGFMGFSHGSNDAQKTMGIITLALVAGTKSGVLDTVPDFFSFLRVMDVTDKHEIPLWIKVICAATMAAGTAAGGWRIIKTMGHSMVKLQPVHGFAAETTAASVIGLASVLGMTVSTTHAITTSIMGVGCAKRWSALNFPVVKRILWAWVLTIPCTAVLGYLFMELSRLFTK